MDQMKVSRHFLYELRLECKYSPYSDAVIKLGKRTYRYNEERWEEFLRWQAEEEANHD
ncbi:MAG: DNA-binding protein [Lactobacillus delbrueckii]|jgi:hypothetical protein|nr:Hypothetical protein orf66 [Lactobacillus delbrueckii subsp. bulgaricus ND02]GHN47159.1 hypothetical protein ME799_07650 [Lactobacillus delbrueckii]